MTKVTITLMYEDYNPKRMAEIIEALNVISGSKDVTVSREEVEK